VRRRGHPEGPAQLGPRREPAAHRPSTMLVIPAA
jgi:hypothetical protein